MEALAKKILVLGIDGMDPKFTKHCMAKGGMKNLKEIIRRGAAREDLVMMGGQPTVTPPMRTPWLRALIPAPMASLLTIDSRLIIWVVRSTT